MQQQFLHRSYGLLQQIAANGSARRRRSIGNPISLVLTRKPAWHRRALQLSVCGLSPSRGAHYLQRCDAKRSYITKTQVAQNRTQAAPTSLTCHRRTTPPGLGLPRAQTPGPAKTEARIFFGGFSSAGSRCCDTDVECKHRTLSNEICSVGCSL